MITYLTRSLHICEHKCNDTQRREALFGPQGWRERWRIERVVQIGLAAAGCVRVHARRARKVCELHISVQIRVIRVTRWVVHAFIDIETRAVWWGACVASSRSTAHGWRCQCVDVRRARSVEQRAHLLEVAAHCRRLLPTPLHCCLHCFYPSWINWGALACREKQKIIKKKETLTRREKD